MPEDPDSIDSTNQPLEDDGTDRPRGGWWSHPVAWAPAVALVLALFTSTFMICMCGHLAWHGLLLSVPAAVLGGVSWALTKTKFPARLFHIIAFLFAFWVLAWNIADVLWFGHDPLWVWK